MHNPLFDGLRVALVGFLLAEIPRPVPSRHCVCDVTPGRLAATRATLLFARGVGMAGGECVWVPAFGPSRAGLRGLGNVLVAGPRTGRVRFTPVRFRFPHTILANPDRRMSSHCSQIPYQGSGDTV